MKDLPFDVDQMRLVDAIAACGSLSAAASQLGISQPTASQQLRKIEERLDRKLFNRSRSGLIKTIDGEAYLLYSRSMLNIGEEARRYFSNPRIEGSLRFGLTEDFARTVLPEALEMFARLHPNFEFRCDSGLSTPLFAALDDKQLDVVVAKRPVGRPDSEMLWREELAWFARLGSSMPPDGRIKIVTFPDPSETRDAMIAAIKRSRRPWQLVFQSSSLMAVEAAVRAGIGISAFGRRMHPIGLLPLEATAGLPALGSIEVVMERNPDSTSVASEAFCGLLREWAVLSVHDSKRPVQK